MAQILYGAPVAEALNAKTAARAEALRAQGVAPKLAIVRVSEEPDQISYERGAGKRCAAVGVEVLNALLPQTATTEEVLACVQELNEDASVHGILLLQPLPAQVDSELIRNSIDQRKDVDVAGVGMLGRVLLGDKRAFAPCTAQACIEMLDYYGIEVEGKKAVVLGRSLIVGKPAAMLLLGKNATVTICHSRTADLPSVVRDADIVVAAIGRARMLGADYASEGQVIVDVGINWDAEAGKLCGDVDFDAVEPVVAAVTPVPQGVGSVTTSVLVEHVVCAAEETLA